jgi:hypothetical protein
MNRKYSALSNRTHSIIHFITDRHFAIKNNNFSDKVHHHGIKQFSYTLIG